MWNFATGHKENLKLNVQMDTTIYHVGFKLSGGHCFNPTIESTIILDTKKASSIYSKEEDKQRNKRNWYVNAGLEARFDIRPTDILSVSVDYGYNGDKDKAKLDAMRNNIGKDTLTGNQFDTVASNEHRLEPKINYLHTFGKADSKLTLSVLGLIDNKEESMIRTVGGNYYSRQKYYQTVSSLNDLDTRLLLHYDDASLAGVKNLKFCSGVDVFFNNDIDLYNGSNRVNGEWRDSTALKQSYYYYSFALEPFVNAGYTYKRFSFYVNERVQWYYHQLMDKLEEKKSEQYQFQKDQWQNILAAGFAFKFNSRHKIGLDYKRTLSRPDYKKLSTTYVIGSSEGEYMHGNPDLKPQTTDDASMTYCFTAEHFSLDLTAGYRYTENKVEKVLDVIPEGETGMSTVFTWINANKQHTGRTVLNLKINYAEVQARMWLGTYYDTYIKKENTIDKTDFNFDVGIDLSAMLTPTLRLSSTLTYRSAKASAYNVKGEYIGADFRLTKTFLDKLDLYVNINDLVDKNDYEQTWNAQYTYYKVVEKQLGRRSVQVGIVYNF